LGPTSGNKKHFDGTARLKIDIFDGYQKILALPGARFLRTNAQSIQIYDVKTGRIVRNLTSSYIYPYVLGLLSNGEIVAGYNGNKSYVVFDPLTEEDPIKRVVASSEYFQCLTVLDGDDIAVGQYGLSYDIVIRDTAAFNLKKRLIGHMSTVYQIIQLPGNKLASCSSDKNLIIWNIQDGSKLRVIPHDSSIYSIALLTNGNVAAGVFNYNLVHEWNVLEGQSIRIYRGLSNYVCNFNCLHVLGNGDILAGSYNTALTVWHPYYHNQIMQVNRHTSEIRQLEFTNDGTLITSSRTEIIIWN
jgi:WD40 repeat protein